MIVYRRRLGKFISNLRGPEPGLASGKPPEKQANQAYLAILVLVVLATVAIVFVVANSFWKQVLLAALWGIFLGSTFLLYLGREAVITISGSVLGLFIVDGSSDIANVPTTITEANKSIEIIILALTGGAVEITIVPLAHWIFLALIVICCIPAYKQPT